MGSFSFIRADLTTERANLSDGDKYKILVPKEFGGGYIEDVYPDYGDVFAYSGGRYVDGEGNIYEADKTFEGNDLYGILAWWNNVEGLVYIQKKPETMIEILKYGETDLQENRTKGISIGCYDKDVDKLKYPLKLVSRSCKDTYETCYARSYGDPNQGFDRYKWTDRDYRVYKEKIIKSEIAKMFE